MMRKKLFKFAIMSAIAIGLMATSAAWAAKSSSSEKIDKHLAMLKERLQLTDIQTQKVKVILEESQRENMAMRSKTMTDKTAASRMYEEHRKATDDKIRAVLTDEQKKEFDQMNMESHQAMMGKMEHKNMGKMMPGESNESGAAKSGGTGDYSGGK
jgi:LTXXQ motif family protein